jgi:hypothetical protein
MTVSLAVVTTSTGRFTTHRQVAEVAAELKKKAINIAKLLFEG